MFNRHHDVPPITDRSCFYYPEQSQVLPDTAIVRLDHFSKVGMETIIRGSRYRSFVQDLGNLSRNPSMTDATFRGSIEQYQTLENAVQVAALGPRFGGTAKGNPYTLWLAGRAKDSHRSPFELMEADTLGVFVDEFDLVGAALTNNRSSKINVRARKRSAAFASVHTLGIRVDNATNYGVASALLYAHATSQPADRPYYVTTTSAGWFDNKDILKYGLSGTSDYPRYLQAQSAGDVAAALKKEQPCLDSTIYIPKPKAARTSE